MTERLFSDIITDFDLPPAHLQSLKGATGRQAFFNVFQLRPHTPFGELLSSMLRMLEAHLHSVPSIEQSYTYWRDEIQHGVIPPKAAIPDYWLPFLEYLTGPVQEKTLKFMFALESALVLLSKLILLKACDDLHFPDVSLKSELLSNSTYFKEYFPPFAYPLVVLESYDLIDEKMIVTPPEEATYSWWQGLFQDLLELYHSKRRDLVLQKVDITLVHFGLCLMTVLIALYRFKFENIEDLLGDLYQGFFPVETRKALGEFYTAKEVVRRILDDVGYTAHVTEKRLLDPACGSGTFLIEALKRYLQAIQPLGEAQGWHLALSTLFNEPKIVGFDINPFACLISQIRFLIELIPFYKMARELDPQFLIHHLPILLTDSLVLDDPASQQQLKQSGQYDFVVGNPPYVRVIKIPHEKRDYFLGKSIPEPIYESATGRLNLYILFLERAISRRFGFLKENGMLGFILPTSFLVYSGYGFRIRIILLRDSEIVKMINLNLCSKSIFSQDVSTQILILKRTNTPRVDYEFLSTIIKRDDCTLLNTLSDEVIDNGRILTDYIPINPSLNDENKIISPLFFLKNLAILDKMMSDAVPLQKVAQISQCIRIGNNQTRNLVLKSQADYLTLSPEEQLAWRRTIDARDTAPFVIRWNGSYLKYFPENEQETLYLPRSENGRREKQDLFEQPKLLFKNTAQHLTVSFDVSNERLPSHERFYFPLNTLYCIVPTHEPTSDESGSLLKYFLGFLNSPIAEFWYRVIHWGLAIPGGGIKYREVLKNIPIKRPTPISRPLFDEIVTLVDRIITLTQTDPSLDDQAGEFRTLQQELNDLLFRYHSLNADKEYILQFLNAFCPKISSL